MGYFAFYAGLTVEAYDAARAWVGRLPGGLALTTVGGCALFFTSDPWMFSEDAERFSMPGMLARFYQATTGLDMSEEDVLRAGERIVNIERAYNVREGLTRRDDNLPDRMLKEPMPDGFAKGQVVDLESMLDEYYGFRGWDKDSGLPTKKKLLELGLDDIADELEGMGKLAP